MSPSPALNLVGIQAGYGKDDVIYDIDVSVDHGEIVTIIGHNGAGKSTLLRTAHGLLSARKGRVELMGDDVTRASTSARVRAGMAFVPENHFVFPELTVTENLQLGRHQNRDADEDELLEGVHEQFPVLSERARQRAGTMSGGERRILSIATALMAEPKVLLLDEPSLGLAPVLVEQVMESVRRIAVERHLSVILVEQNVEHALRLADRAYVVRAGRVVHTSTTDEMGSGRELLAFF